MKRKISEFERRFNDNYTYDLYFFETKVVVYA